VGALQESRSNIVRIYSKRLGTPPTDVVARLEAIENMEALHAMIDRFDEQIECWEQLLP